jgi:magnesium transporter
MAMQMKDDWVQLRDLLEQGASAADVENYLDSLQASEVLHQVLHLPADEQRRLLRMISAERAADILSELPESLAANLMEPMSAAEVASIVGEMASDDRVDILGELPEAGAAAILEQLDEEDADEIRRLSTYAPDTAGGLMMTEFAAYPMAATIREVLSDLTARDGEYEFLTVHYVYVVVKRHRLRGVIRIRDLLFADWDQPIGAVARPAHSVLVDTSLNDLSHFFEEHDFAAVPVVDERKNLLGIVRRRSVLEAETEQSEAARLKQAGIVGGEELRSMPVLVRSRRRLSWLSVNILLNIIAASVIAFYEDTLSALIALAVFLPIVSDMSGCSGNQAVAVSMRELTLGAASPRDVFRVWRKELSVGLLNGAALGTLLGLAAWAWKGSPVLGLVVGAALAINTVVAVSIGGTVPLVLKRFGVDPAIGSGPLLTTITDMCGFFLVLSLASLAMPYLV